jgi:hypothetical protein
MPVLSTDHAPPPTGRVLGETMIKYHKNSPRTAAIKAGQGKATVVPDEVLSTHFAPPINPGQTRQDEDDEL